MEEFVTSIIIIRPQSHSPSVEVLEALVAEVLSSTEMVPT